MVKLENETGMPIGFITNDMLSNQNRTQPIVTPETHEVKVKEKPEQLLVIKNPKVPTTTQVKNIVE